MYKQFYIINKASFDTSMLSVISVQENMLERHAK